LRQESYVADPNPIGAPAPLSSDDERPGACIPAWRIAVAVTWSLVCGPVVALLLTLRGGAWWAMAGYHVGCVIATRAVDVKHERPARPVLLALVLLASLGVVIGAGASANREIWSGGASLWRGWGLAPPGDLVWLAYYALVNPWIEERYWRGALLGDAVTRRIGRRAARTLAVVAFLDHHAVVLVPSFGWRAAGLLCIAIGAAAACWVWMHERTRGLAFCIASHAGADAGLVLLYLLWVRA